MSNLIKQLSSARQKHDVWTGPKSRANYILDPQKQKKKKNTEDNIVVRKIVSWRININELYTDCRDGGYEIKLKILGFVFELWSQFHVESGAKTTTARMWNPSETEVIQFSSRSVKNPIRDFRLSTLE